MVEAPDVSRSAIRALLGPIRSFLGRQFVLSGLAALATALLGGVAAWVDGHAPTLPGLLRLALPTGAFSGMAAAVALWRAERGDVALASLGLRAAPLLAVATLVAGLMAAAAPQRPSGLAVANAHYRLEPEPGRLHVVAPSGSDLADLDVTFGSEGARRSDLSGDAALWAALPGPSATRVPHAARWGGGPWIWGLLALPIAPLQRAGDRPPGAARTLLTVALCLLLGFLGGA